MQIILLKANKWASSRFAAKRFQHEMARAHHGTVLVIPEGVDVEVIDLEGDAMPPLVNIDTDLGEVEFLKPEKNEEEQLDLPLTSADDVQLEYAGRNPLDLSASGDHIE